MPLVPHDLHAALREIYETAGLTVTSAAVREPESAEYGAYRIGLSGRNIVFRVAKTTPTKIGQFVTIWKRPAPGDEIAPFDLNDDVDFVVVSVYDATHRGQFVFDRKQLLVADIMSRNGDGGKRAIRVYPPWCKPVVKMAINTQRWQLHYFFPVSDDGSADPARVRKLFGL